MGDEERRIIPRRESAMIFKTVDCILHPDGRVTLPPADLPIHPMRVLVTLLESDEGADLAELGDYHEQLRDYEERQERGKIQWE
jgi:hypothetical protein